MAADTPSVTVAATMVGSITAAGVITAAGAVTMVGLTITQDRTTTTITLSHMPTIRRTLDRMVRTTSRRLTASISSPGK